MTDCPAYLGIQVIDRTSRTRLSSDTDDVIVKDDVTEVAKADLLILCPLQFNVTILIPVDFDVISGDTEDDDDSWNTWDVKSTLNVHRGPITFEVVLSDPHGVQFRTFQTYVRACVYY